MISVIVPVYNVEPYLRQCLESIINQTYRDIEIILIDDGSPDKCGEICEEYRDKDNRIKVYHTKNGGLSVARNVGLKAATGEYLGFVDSDDWIELDMYELLLNRLEKTGADISACGFWIESASHQKNTQFNESVYDGSGAIKALMCGKIQNNSWNKLYRRALFQNVLFPEGKNYEDVTVMPRIINNAKKVVTIGDCKYHYRVRMESITKTYTAENLLDYANAHIERYRFFKNKKSDQFDDDEIQKIAAKGISKVWRWWYGCSSEKKQEYRNTIEELKYFSREHFPMLGYRSWPGFLRFSTLFMHSNSTMSFAVLYGLNQAFRKLWQKPNIT